MPRAQQILKPLIEEFAKACMTRNISYILAVQMGPEDILNMPAALSMNIGPGSSPMLKQAAYFSL